MEKKRGRNIDFDAFEMFSPCRNSRKRTKERLVELGHGERQSEGTRGQTREKRDVKGLMGTEQYPHS